MSLCFLQHENEIRVPELVHFGGNIYFEDAFSIKWFNTKTTFLIASSLLYGFCFIFYGMEFGFASIGWWFTYYSYLNFTLWLIYLTLSLMISTRIYRSVKNNELPQCCQSSQSYHFTTDTDDDNDDNDDNNRDNHDVDQLHSSFLATLTTFFHYISLVGLWCGAILFWMHEFEVQVYRESSFRMRFIVIVVYILVQMMAATEFFMSGFRLKYSGFIWPLLMMVIVVVMNMVQIITGELDGEWNQHLFTELNWNHDVESALVTCFWAMAMLLICNVSFTFLKNICLCKWSLNQRRKERYPAAQEADNQVVEI